MLETLVVVDKFLMRASLQVWLLIMGRRFRARHVFIDTQCKAAEVCTDEAGLASVS